MDDGEIILMMVAVGATILISMALTVWCGSVGVCHYWEDWDAEEIFGTEAEQEEVDEGLFIPIELDMNLMKPNSVRFVSFDESRVLNLARPPVFDVENSTAMFWVEVGKDELNEFFYVYYNLEKLPIRMVVEEFDAGSWKMRLRVPDCVMVNVFGESGCDLTSEERECQFDGIWRAC